MRFRAFATLAASLTASLVAAGCGNDSPVAPAASQTATAPTTIAPTTPESKSLLGGVLGTVLGSPTQVTALQRSTPLPSNLSTSAKIGPLGGILALPGAGLTIIVPPLAVLAPTTITVTARAGASVAYDFEPHGIRFNVPLVATQALGQTMARNGGSVNPLGLFVGYYPDGSHITDVTELLDLHLDLLNQAAIVSIWHFSGYIFASGRNGGDGGGN